MATPTATRELPRGRMAPEREPTEADKHALADALARALAPLVIRDVPSPQDTATTAQGA